MYCSLKQEHVSSKYFNVLLDNSIISKSDLEGNITYVNENFVKVTGFSKDECLGKNHNILRHPDVKDEVFHELWTIIQKGDIFRERVLSRKKDGSDFWAETIILPLVDESTKKIIEYLAIRNDITEFLEIKREVYNQKIREKEQKKVSDAKNSFLILFSHELKTPLNAMINFSKYLLKNIEKVTIEKRKQLLTEIESSATKMLEDVNSLLDLSKLKSSKLHYNYSIFSISDALSEVVNEHLSLAKQYNTVISTCTNNEQYYINSDFYRFKQILANVLSNAIKYADKNVRIAVSTNEEICTITIEDDGEGVEDKEQIFNLFEQNEENIKTRDKNGTGLGLSFVSLLSKDLGVKYVLKDSIKLGGLSFNLNINLIKG